MDRSDTNALWFPSRMAYTTPYSANKMINPASEKRNANPNVVIENKRYPDIRTVFLPILSDKEPNGIAKIV